MIEAIEDNITLSETQAKAIDNLLHKIETTNAISRSDVLSLEYMGLPVGLDDYIPLSSFTVTASKVNLERTAKLLNEVKNKATVDIKDAVTTDEIIKLIMQYVYALDTLANTLIHIKNVIDIQAISDLMLDMNSHYYNWNDELIDIRETTVDNATYNALLGHMVEKRGNRDILDEEKLKNMMARLEDGEYYFIFSLLESLKEDHYLPVDIARAYKHRTFTVKEVVDIILNLDTYIDKLKTIIKVASELRFRHYHVTIKDRKAYERLLSILGNKNDITLLEIISYIFKK